MTSSTDQLLSTADRLLSGAPAAMAVGRHRGVAFALRSALERAISDRLLAGPPQIRVRSMRARLLCLRVCADTETARRARAVWALLCLGCHYHHYELGPTEEQLLSWRDEVAAIVMALETSTR